MENEEKVVNPDPEKKEEPVVETEVEEKEEEDDDQFELFQDLLDDEDDAEEDEKSLSDEQRRKNKDAEEARKRREAEAKAKAEAEAVEKEKAEAEARTKAEDEEKAKAETEKQGERLNRLGGQLMTFKQKYPDIDLVNLDKDANFKKYVDGKLLGKKDFTSLYEEYVDLRSSLSGKSQQDVQKDYARKAQSSSGTATPKGVPEAQDVFTEAELQTVAAKLPLMSREAAAKIEAKLQRSIEYHEKQK